MTTFRAQRLIFGIMVVVTIITIVGDIISGKAFATDAIPRRMVAGTIATIMLMVIAIPLPAIAAGLAGIIAIAAAFVNPDGPGVLEAISGATVERAKKGTGGGSSTVK